MKIAVLLSAVFASQILNKLKGNPSPTPTTSSNASPKPTPTDRCKPLGGTCQKESQCSLSSNSIITGKCPGAADVKCCFPDSQPPSNPKDVNGKSVTDLRAAIVDLNTNMLFYYENQKVVRKWNVITGNIEKNRFTPVGNFRIYAKDPCPVYAVPNPPIACYDRNSTNPLGKRALWFQGDYGLHGTSKEGAVLLAENTTPEGRRLSRGCVRNHNDNIVWLYERMTIGDLVVVIGLKKK